MRRIVSLFLFIGLTFAGYSPTNFPNGLGVGEAIRPFVNGANVTSSLTVECTTLDAGYGTVNELTVTTINTSYISAVTTNFIGDVNISGQLKGNAGTFVGILTAKNKTGAGYVYIDRDQVAGDGVEVAQIKFRGRDSGGATTDFAIIRSNCVLDNAGSEKGNLIFQTNINGVPTTVVTMDSAQKTTLAGDINVRGGDISFTNNGAGNFTFDYASADTVKLAMLYTGYAGGTNYSAIDFAPDGTSGGKLVFYTRPDGGAIGSALTLNKDKLATFAGSISATTGTFSGDFILSNPTVPTASTSTCVTGNISYDSNYLYVGVGTNSWKRITMDVW